MSSHDIKSAQRPDPDAALTAIATYARNFTIASDVAYETARYCLMDTLACGFQALKYPACRKLLGPVVPGAVMSGGARVPGTSFELDPVQAAFNIGAMVRWLDFNDTWLAAEWGHPSDNLGRHPRRRRLPGAQRRHVRQGAAHGARRAHRHDQGARDPGRAGAGEQLQPRRPRPRAPGAGRIHRGGDQHARRHARAGRERGLQRLDRRRRAAHLPPRSQHRLAQELGGRGCHQPRGAPRPHRPHRGDGLPVGALGQDLGLQRRAVQGQAAVPAAALRQLRHGERALQDLLPGRVPRADRGGGGDDAAPQGGRAHRRHRAHRHRDPGTGRAHHRQDRPARQSRRPRPLHPVHGGDPADLRPPQRRGLRGRGRPGPARG